MAYNTHTHTHTHTHARTHARKNARAQHAAMIIYYSASAISRKL